MTCGVTELWSFPNELYLTEERLLYGQTLAFQYDQSGRVTKVFLNGEFLTSPSNPPDNSITITRVEEPR